MRTCGDYDIRSTSVRGGDGLSDFVRCGNLATHVVDGFDVCDEHLSKRSLRGDDLRDAHPISPVTPVCECGAPDGHDNDCSTMGELTMLRAQVVALEADVHQRDARIAELEAMVSRMNRYSAFEPDPRIAELEAERASLVTRIVARLRSGGHTWAASVVLQVFGEEAKR